MNVTDNLPSVFMVCLVASGLVSRTLATTYAAARVWARNVNTCGKIEEPQIPNMKVNACGAMGNLAFVF
jgi:hypothetical protein